MLSREAMNNIKIALMEHENALKSRMGREAKKAALANVLINNVTDIIETCLEAEDLLEMLSKERSENAKLRAQIEELTSESKDDEAPKQRKKNG